MKVRVKKQKLKGIDKNQKQKLEDVINLLFTDSTRHMPLQDLVAKYVTYKNSFKGILRAFISINSIVAAFEPKLTDFIKAYMDEYKKYFSFDHNKLFGSDELVDEFYAIYDAFKKSEFIEWSTRIAHRIKTSGMLTMQFREFAIACQNSTIVLNIFTNVIPDVNVTFDFVRVFHEGIDINKDNKLIVLDSIKNIFTLGKKIYKLTIQPDLPLDTIFNELMSSIEKYRSKVRNSNKLFDLLHRKGELFKTNFNKYYKEMVQYKSPVSLFTSFLSDVIKDKDIQDPTVLVQCRNLISELRKSFNAMPGFNKADPNAQKVNTLIDFIGDYIDKYKDIDLKPPDEDISELAERFEKQFINPT